ncbi:hypothetical protein HZA76_00495 [Candidatus Roizmanbacteria bacterium]|nr:hypothetical protein [Candidatus Roizmanbacteria bacterium]
MAKRSSRNLDIHHPKMVKTVFILTSLAILAFLALIVKTTSFKSEPKASESSSNIVFESNGVSCWKLYKGRDYIGCDSVCGSKKLSFKFKFVSTYFAGPVCGYDKFRKPLYPNYSPLDIKGILNRPVIIKTRYCCVSSN